MKISIYAADTLNKFTNQILIKGFEELSVNAVIGSIDSKVDSTADVLLFQLHGAPQAEKDDLQIMELIKESLEDKNEKRKKIIMIHRPDEIQKYSELSQILKVGGFGLVNYGENHLNDEFYPSNVQKKVIPHGFSSNIREIPDEKDHILIGSQTSWGEMRSLEHALILIGEVFNQYKGYKKLFGYIGGKPIEQLQIKELNKKYEHIIHKYSILLMDAKDYNETAPMNTIFINQIKSNRPILPLSFNTQMYYLEDTVRTGEASGTIYRSISIPIILEMNGSLEELNVIKVPYSDSNDLSSIDFKAGAKKIVESINDGSYRNMILHNFEQAKIWNEKKIANEYLNFLKQL